MTSEKTQRVSKTFRLLSIVTVILMVAGVSITLAGIVLIWVPGDLTKKLFADDFAIHRFHAGMISAGTWVLFLSVASQLRKPQEKIATMILAVATVVIFIPADMQSPSLDPLEFVILALLVAMLRTHPGRREVSWRPIHRSAAMVAAIGAVPWLIFAWDRFEEQLNGVGADRHLELGHYGLMSAVALIVLVAVLIGVTSLPGSRLSMALGAGAAAFAGIVSVFLPNQPSSPGIVWGLAALVWAGALIGTTWLPADSSAREASGATAPATHVETAS